MRIPHSIARSATNLRLHLNVAARPWDKKLLAGIGMLAGAGAMATGLVRGVWGFLSPNIGYSRSETAGAEAWAGAKNGLVAGAAMGALSATLCAAGIG